MLKKLNEKGFTLLELLNLILILLIVASLFRGLLVDESVAYRAMQKRGFAESKVINKDWFFVGLRGCGGTDAAKFTVRAKNPRGEDTEVLICSGWIFKAATLRTD